jgi:superfamily II DNA or RNA helicase
MPRIFDNIDLPLAPALQEALRGAGSADFCVGYFNLRGWHLLGPSLRELAPAHPPCRLLIGMHRAPEDLRTTLHGMGRDEPIDQARALRLKRRVAEEFRAQLTQGIPTRQDEDTLRLLSAQLREGQLRVKLFLRNTLHAKLYLIHRLDAVNPRIGFLGSSNLTFPGLRSQGELNVDVLDRDACDKLAAWFDRQWNDRFSLDISEELRQAIDESWVSEKIRHPFHVYLKIAWHLSREARAGLSEFKIPRDLQGKLFAFQEAAVQIAAHHVHARGGVMLGDVVGLGKTLMAISLARILEEDHGYRALILCPRNLVSMWKYNCEQYNLHACIISTSQVMRELPTLRRYQLVIVDESHNLRNREGKRYRAIADYVRRNESRCVLLTATPYNKTYLDLASQLRLFVPEDRDLGVRPEALMRTIGEGAFIGRYQCSPRSLAAFEKSENVDDWRELMRLFLIRRTRSFIREHYAQSDPTTGRKFLVFQNGEKAWFPDRIPRTLSFSLDEGSASDAYARLYSNEVVQTITTLALPRYGLGDFIRPDALVSATPEEKVILAGLAKAGQRLQGFCRVNLFKRLESSGAAFLSSVERHALRNQIFLHAIQQGMEIPIGPQESELLDESPPDDEQDQTLFDNDEDSADEEPVSLGASLETRARSIYQSYRTTYARRFRWVSSSLFKPALKAALKKDTEALIEHLRSVGPWDPQRDTKLEMLAALLLQRHATEKVLIFTQFADTAEYLRRGLEGLGVSALECVTGNSEDPTSVVRRFSPRSNNQAPPADEVRVLVATDILSEGQNLQDAAIVVNYDLPWAVIRLVQRAGRVDRIGQSSPQILCYSFLPSDGVERLIRLRSRMRQRLLENARVVGTDEAFFDDDNSQQIVDLYNEKAGILDGEGEGDVDLASYALQIWKDSIAADPTLERIIPALPSVVYATRPAQLADSRPPGAIVFVRTAQDTDALVHIDSAGQCLTSSQFEILRLAQCRADTLALPPRADHHELVAHGVGHILEEEITTGGQLGSRAGPRYKVYERLKRLADLQRGTLFENHALSAAIDEIYQHPLQSSASDSIARQLRGGISDDQLVELILVLRDEGRLCFLPGISDGTPREAVIVCSMGIQA